MLLLLLFIGGVVASGGAVASAGDVSAIFGIPIFPGAEPRPEVAKAVEAYYQPGITARQALSAAVFVTPAAFGAVTDFYGPKMDSGKWGWRKKTYPLLHQVQTLKFMRSQLATRRGEHANGLSPVFQPLFGDPTWSQDQFGKRLDALLAEHKDVKIEIAEGTRTASGDSKGAQVRVTIERPYIDLAAMQLVAKTRIVLVEVADK